MKNTMFFLAAFVLATLISCSKETETLDVATAQTLKMDEAGAIYESEFWGGDIDCDCAPGGANCAVIYPDRAAQVADFINAVEKDNLSNYFSNGGKTLGLSEEVVKGVIKGNVDVYVKKSGNKMQYRFK